MWPPFKIWLNSIISWIKLDRVLCFTISLNFLCISWSFARPQAKTQNVKLELLLIETLISYFLLLMRNISNSDYPVLCQLKQSWSSHQPHHQPFFSKELGINFESQFCDKIEDTFNGGMPCTGADIGGWNCWQCSTPKWLTLISRVDISFLKILWTRFPNLTKSRCGWHCSERDADIGWRIQIF